MVVLVGVLGVAGLLALVGGGVLLGPTLLLAFNATRPLPDRVRIYADDRIGTQLERSERMILAILGVFKSGGAYVPIDPTYPEDRIHYMLSDCQARIVISEAEILEAGPYELTRLQSMFLFTRSDTIYGGTNQVQRNIIAELIHLFKL